MLKYCICVHIYFIIMIFGVSLVRAMLINRTHTHISNFGFYMIYTYIYYNLKNNKFHFLCLGERSCCKTVSSGEKRTRQNAMTSDPDLVWPGAKVFFKLDSSVGEINRKPAH